MTLLSVAIGLGIAALLVAAVLWAYIKMEKCRGWILLFSVFFVLGAFRMKAEMRPGPMLLEEVRASGETVLVEGKILDITSKEKQEQQTEAGQQTKAQQQTKAEKQGRQYTLTLERCQLRQGEQKTSLARMLIYIDEEALGDVAPKELKAGRRVCAAGTIPMEEKPGNPGEFDFILYYQALKIDGRMFGTGLWIMDQHVNFFRHGLYRIKEHAGRILGLIAEPEDAGVFRAAILGDKSSLDAEIRDLYQKNGIAHLLAISGLHVSIIGMGIYGLLRKTGLRFGTAGLLSGMFLISYGIMTGASASVVRAVIMLLSAFLAGYLGRTYDLISAACMACILLLADAPYLITQGGFQLSFGAVLAIGGVGESLIRAMEAEKLWQKTILTSLSIQLVTYPVVLYHFYQYPVYGIILNFFVIPLMTYVIYSGVAGILLGSLTLAAGAAAVGSGHYILDLYRRLCVWCSRLPGYTMIAGRPDWWQIGFYYGILAAFFMVFLYGRNRTQKLPWSRLVCLIGICFCLLLHVPVQGLEVTFLDVGQGDGIFLETRGCRVLVDGGSTSEKELGKRRLEPFLKSKGVSKLDYVFVSHGDADHISGIVYLLESVPDIEISNLILPCLSEDDEAYEPLKKLTVSRGGKVFLMAAGESLENGRLRISCLYPGREDPAADRNEQSLILKADYGDFHMLLTGDTSSEAEARLLEQLGTDTADTLGEIQVLKAAHHGSGTSSSQAFLEAAAPRWTVVSYGKDNRYGHPDKEVMERLYQQKTEIWETAKCGAVMLKTDGERIQWKSMK